MFPNLICFLIAEIYGSYILQSHSFYDFVDANWTWNPGDIISCPIDNGIIGSHRMMAISNEDVIHVVGNKVRKQQRHLAHGFKRYPCEIWERSGEAAAERAKKYIDVCVPYDLWTCNCQHYTSYWALGYRPSWWHVQTFRNPSSECLRTDIDPCPATK